MLDADCIYDASLCQGDHKKTPITKTGIQTQHLHNHLTFEQSSKDFACVACHLRELI